MRVCRPCRLHRRPPHQQVGVFGASGYAGAELLRLLAGHPHFEVVARYRRHPGRRPGGGPVPEPGRGLPRPGARPRPTRPRPTGWTWCSWPCRTGRPRSWYRNCASGSGTVVDLAADFRLRDPALYPQWYGSEHRCPDLLAEAVTGIPELFGADLPGATLVAAAGCYPTAAALALAPLVRAGVIDAQRRRGGRGQRGVRGGPGAQAAHPLQRRRRGLHRLRAARPPPHARDRAGDRGRRSSSPPTWRR